MFGNDYNWKITIWKGVQIFVFGGIAGLIEFLLGLPTAGTLEVTTVIAILRMLQNFIKNAEVGS